MWQWTLRPYLPAPPAATAQIRLARSAGCPLVGAGNPPLHRFRVGLEFAFSGHRQLDGMISQHAKLARTLAEQLGLPGPVPGAVGAAYGQWDGRGWPG